MTHETPQGAARPVPLGDLIGCQQRVLDAARRFRETRQAYIRVRTSGANGREIAAARHRRDMAIDELVVADEELEKITSVRP